MTALDTPTALDAGSADLSLAAAAGRVLVAAGAVFGLANLFQGLVMNGTLPLSPALLSVSWPTAVAAFLIVLNRLKCVGGPNARRVAGWSRFTIGAQIAAALALLLLSVVTGRWAWMMWMSVAGMAMYGVVWSLAAVRTRTLWIGAVGLGAFAAAAAIAPLVGTPAQYLAYACGLVAFTLVPGLVLAIRGRI